MRLNSLFNANLQSEDVKEKRLVEKNYCFPLRIHTSSLFVDAKDDVMLLAVAIHVEV